MSIENRQKIPVPRRFFLWSINESSGEILTHVGPTEFTPSANDRIVRDKPGGGALEVSPLMEARPFVVARDGEYVILSNPIRGETNDEMPNGIYIPGGNKEKELILGGRRVIPGPCGFPLWPGQAAEVRPAHKLGANHYLLAEVIGPIDEKAPYAKLVMASAGLSSAVIDSGEAETHAAPSAELPGPARQLRLGQRIVIQGRHTQLFIPPTGIEVVPQLEEMDVAQQSTQREDDGLSTLSTQVAQECAKLVSQVQAGLSTKQFSVLKNELRHRADLSASEKAIVLTALDSAWEDKQGPAPKAGARGRAERGDGRSRTPADPYARRAVVLGPKEFCFLFDADGNARIVRGPARVFPGPYDTFLQRGSRKRSYDAFELAEHQALWIRIISPITRDKLAGYLPPGFPLEKDTYEAGHELIVRGKPSVFFPFIEAEVVNPSTREPHVGNDHENVIIDAIGIDQKAGIHVRDLRTGIVRLVRGETSYLVDPRFEEHVHRRVPREQWNLTIAHAEPHKATSDGYVTTPWAMSVSIPNNEAVLVSSHHQRRVELGPKVVLLEYEEQLAELKLSKGPSKDGHTQLSTSFLRVQGARVADTFELESSDFVRFKVKVGFMGHFEGEPQRWFQVDDPVKLLADTARAKVREAARVETATRLLKDLPAIVRQTVLKDGAPLKFVENGMVIDSVDVLHVSIVDSDLAQLFAQAQREAVKLQLLDEQAVRRLASSRHQDQIGAQESQLKAEEAKRRAQGGIVEAESLHSVELRAAQLKSEREAQATERKQSNDKRLLDFQLTAEQRVSEAQAARRLQDAEAQAKASEALHLAEEKHRQALAAIEKDLARAHAEADSVKLGAIQPELVGALHAAADSEVMKAAATNMNLVSLLGGKSPAEILAQILRGTPLDRTTRNMHARSHDGAPTKDADGQSGNGSSDGA